MNAYQFEAIVRELHKVANSITPTDVLPATTDNGRSVSSLTEAVMYLGDGLMAVADAIRGASDNGVNAIDRIDQLFQLRGGGNAE